MAARAMALSGPRPRCPLLAAMTVVRQLVTEHGQQRRAGGAASRLIPLCRPRPPRRPAAGWSSCLCGQWFSGRLARRPGGPRPAVQRSCSKRERASGDHAAKGPGANWTCLRGAPVGFQNRMGLLGSLATLRPLICRFTDRRSVYGTSG